MDFGMMTMKIDEIGSIKHAENLSDSGETHPKEPGSRAQETGFSPIIGRSHSTC
jgi:hypothetical protein